MVNENKTYRLGTRKSALAQTQSRFIQELLEKQGVSTEIVFIESQGDQNRKDPLYAIENATPGLFTKQLEDALLNNSIDLAVHSLKDLPTTQPSGLQIASIPQRVSVNDLLLIHPDSVDEERPLQLKEGAVVGTSSLRREALLCSYRSDLQFKAIRGNVPTRIKNLQKGPQKAPKKVGYDAIVLAEAGLQRLGIAFKDLTPVTLDPQQFVPAPGQGALAVEIRETDSNSSLGEALKGIHDPAAARCVNVERAILKELEGGCTLPFGALAEQEKNGKALKIKAFLGSFLESGKTREWNSFRYFEDFGESDRDLIARAVSQLSHQHLDSP